jgi:hypothetical protein
VKKLTILLATAAMPFLLVWAAFILTGFNFNPHNVFNEGSFWGVSVLYWFLWVCLCPMIVEMVDEDTILNKSKKVEKKATTLSKEEMIQKHISAEPSRQNPQYEAFVRDAMNKLK